MDACEVYPGPMVLSCNVSEIRYVSYLSVDGRVRRVEPYRSTMWTSRMEPDGGGCAGPRGRTAEIRKERFSGSSPERLSRGVDQANRDMMVSVTVAQRSVPHGP